MIRHEGAQRKFGRMSLRVHERLRQAIYAYADEHGTTTNAIVEKMLHEWALMNSPVYRAMEDARLSRRGPTKGESDDDGNDEGNTR